MFMFPWIDQGIKSQFNIVFIRRKNGNFQNQCLYIKTKTSFDKIIRNGYTCIKLN